MLHHQDKDALRALRADLEARGYTDLLLSYGSREVRDGAFVFDAGLLPSELAWMLRFFALGQPIPREASTALLSPESWALLERLGLCADDGDQVALDGLRLVGHAGVLALVERPRVNPQFYYGDDSLALAGILGRPRGAVLDLCAGVGTQGLLAAQSARRVLSVERQESVARLYGINAVLNGVEDRMELRVGEGAAVALGERFELVACNPPLLPVPSGLAFPHVGGGGPDGLAVTLPLLASLPDLLEPGGRAAIVGTLLGDDEGPFLAPLERVAAERALDLLLVLPGRGALTPGAGTFEALVGTAERCGAPDARAAYEALLSAEGATQLYAFLLSARLARGGGRVRTTGHYLRSTGFWTF